VYVIRRGGVQTGEEFNWSVGVDINSSEQFSSTVPAKYWYFELKISYYN
jgi:hypothetical protein